MCLIEILLRSEAFLALERIKFNPIFWQGHLEFRCHLRYELLLLGIQPVLEELRAYENDLLDKHISFFELIRKEDEDEIASRYDLVSLVSLFFYFFAVIHHRFYCYEHKNDVDFPVKYGNVPHDQCHCILQIVDVISLRIYENALD